MSSDYTVYTKGDPSAIRALVEAFLGLRLCAPSFPSKSVQHAEIIGISVTFDDAHEMIDDMGIPFGQFPIAIEFARSAAQGDPDLRENLCRNLAELLGRHLQRATAHPNIVVRDSQAIVACNPNADVSPE